MEIQKSNTASANAKILLVDNDKTLQEKLSKLLQANGYEVLTADDSINAGKTIIEKSPQVIISETHLEKDTSGFELLYQLRAKNPKSKFFQQRETPFIILSKIYQETNFRFSYSDDDSYLPKLQGIFSKPIEDDDLLKAVSEAIN